MVAPRRTLLELLPHFKRQGAAVTKVKTLTMASVAARLGPGAAHPPHLGQSQLVAESRAPLLVGSGKLPSSWVLSERR